MKTTPPALMAYYWKSGSWSLWCQACAAPLVFALLFGMPFFLDHRYHLGQSWELMKTLYLTVFFPLLFFPVILGLRFFVQIPPQESVRSVPFSDAEFLLSRPITRRQAQRASRNLYYGLVLLMLLPIFGIAAFHPTHNVLFLSAIPAFFVFFSSVAVQGLALISWSPKAPRYILPAFMMVPAWWNLHRIRSPHGNGGPSLDALFQAFVHHAPLIFLSGALLFLLVQFLSARRAESADVL
jgi:hypothetical protein